MNILIKGGGFKAMYMAFKLLENKCNVVIHSKNWGGIYNSIEFNNYFLDYGCHLFDINENRFFDTMLIEDKEIIKVDLRYLSINDIEITEDYSLMDLRKYRIKSKINLDILSKIPNNNAINNLWDWYEFIRNTWCNDR